MGNCCTSRDKSFHNENIKGYGVSDLNSNLNEVQKSLLYVSKFLDESILHFMIICSDRDAQMIAFCFAKDQLNNFVLCLSQIITIIKTKTGQIFIPIVLQNSPINP